jgi:hypothetical protein
MERKPWTTSDDCGGGRELPGVDRAILDHPNRPWDLPPRASTTTSSKEHQGLHQACRPRSTRGRRVEITERLGRSKAAQHYEVARLEKEK